MNVNLETIYVAGFFIALNGLFESSSYVSDDYKAKVFSDYLTLLAKKQIYTGWVRKENLTI